MTAPDRSTPPDKGAVRDQEERQEQSGKAMTAGLLRGFLADVPDHIEVVVHADNADGEQVFAALKSVSFERTCTDMPVLRLFADQEDEQPELCTVNIAPDPDRLPLARSMDGRPLISQPLPPAIYLCGKSKPCPDHREAL